MNIYPRHKPIAYGSRNQKLLGANAGASESDAVHMLMFNTNVANTVLLHRNVRLYNSDK